MKNHQTFSRPVLHLGGRDRTDWLDGYARRLLVRHNARARTASSITRERPGCGQADIGGRCADGVARAVPAPPLTSHNESGELVDTDRLRSGADQRPGDVPGCRVGEVYSELSVTGVNR